MAVNLTPADDIVKVVLVVAPLLLRPSLAREGSPLVHRVPDETWVCKHRPPRAVLFIGPSLPAEHVEKELGEFRGVVDIRPPVEQGDLLRLVSQRPEIVGVVDGFFDRVPAVTHKEILLLLECGVDVLGAASMGALRAAELDGLGMEGIGTVWQLFRDGALDSDDEVAVAHAWHEQHFRQFSEALVCIRCRVDTALERGTINPASARLLLTAAGTLSFRDRTAAAIARGGSALGASASTVATWRRFTEEPGGVKQEDALALVRAVRSRLEGTKSPGRHRSDVRVPRTRYLEALSRDYVDSLADGDYVPDSLTLDLYKLEPESTAMLDVAWRRTCGMLLRERLHWTPNAESRGLIEARLRAEPWWIGATELSLALAERDAGDRFADVIGTGSAAGKDAARALGVNPSALSGAPHIGPGAKSDASLLRALKLSGGFPAARRSAVDVLRNLNAVALLPHAEELLAEHRVVRWCAARWKCADADIWREADRRWFLNAAGFLKAARLAYASSVHTIMERCLQARPGPS